MNPTQPRYLIVGGTIKAATSSVFNYLSAHPEVCGSSIKETFFFTHEYTGDRQRDLQSYAGYFRHCAGAAVRVEASPNYLGYRENIPERIRSLVPGAKLLFILRNPVDRLFSYYNFARSKFDLPAQISFEEFVALCRQEPGQRATALLDRHAQAVAIGHYSRFLRNYLDVFPREQIKVVFYEHLRPDPVRFMSDICAFAGIAPAFYAGYAFENANVTTFARLKPLHLLALLANRALEPLLRQRPELKSRIRGVYWNLNRGGAGQSAISPETRAMLADLYAPSNAELAELLAGQKLPPWVRNAAAPAGSSR